MPRQRKPRDLGKTPKWAQPKYYREFLHKAMTTSGRDNPNNPRPAAGFSKACMANAHERCHGYIETDYSKATGRQVERKECICHCHSELVE